MRLRTPVTLIFQSLVLSWMCVLSMAASAQVDTGALSLAARDQVSVVFSNGTYNRRTGQTSYTATATNIGSETLAGAFYLEIADISVLTVSVVNGADVNMDGEAVYIARLDSLGPSEQLTYTVIFSSRDRITYTANFYSAPVITETDDDHDGIGNTLDQCPNTLSGELVDAGGCSTSQRDSDGDGIPDSIDNDRDNDGVDDDEDAFPDNAAEWSDIDLDGFGDNVDPDRDNDGVANADDAFPNDPAETADLDGDGIGDNSDPDRDNDGVVNADDIFPDDSAESSDLDGDGKGDNIDADRDGDGILNISDAYPDDASRNALPIVTIDTPQTLSTVGASPIDVTGIVDAGAVSFTLNGVSTAIVDGNYAAAVDLSEGHNTVVARMVHADGAVSTASISVSLDLTPPYLTVESHKDGEMVYTDTVAIAGLVNDIVRGTIESDQAVVEVNGVPASIQNRSYLAENIALREGENVLEIVGIDQVGNFSKKQITLIYKPVVGRSLEIVSGQNQSGLIRSELSQPLSIKVLDEYSNPVAQKNVVFRVIQGAGLLTDVDDVGEKAVLIKTNDEGVASVNFSLGQRAGKGNHKVVARVVGYEQELVFYASATQGIGNKLSVNSGNNQRGGVFQPLPAPFVVVVTDLGANAVQGSRVEFGVKQGGGHFQNESDVYVAVTDSDGRATAHLTLGALTGLDRQLITAKLLDARPGEELSAGFTASGFEVGDPGETTISGIVMDTEDNPLPNVTIRIDGTNRETTSGIDGQFAIENAPVGPVHLIVDGATTTVDGEYPTLSYNIVTVAGVENPLSAPVYMVKLDEASAVYAGATDAILSLSVFWLVIQHEPVVFAAQQVLLIASGLGLIAYAALKGSREEFQQMLVLMVLIGSTIVFWALFEQAAGSMTLFADRVVDRNIAGIEITAGQFGSLNAGFIILLSLPFAALWVWLDKFKLNPNIPIKFALGIMQAGLGFGVLVIGAQYPNEAGKISLWWLVLAYLIHTTGELCLSPVGLSAVTKLAIHRVVGLSMGVWFLATALSETLAMRLGKLAAIDTHSGEVGNISENLLIYTQLFEFLTWIGIGTGAAILLISPLLKRGMHGVR